MVVEVVSKGMDEVDGLVSCDLVLEVAGEQD